MRTILCLICCLFVVEAFAESAESLQENLIQNRVDDFVVSSAARVEKQYQDSQRRMANAIGSIHYLTMFEKIQLWVELESIRSDFAKLGFASRESFCQKNKNAMKEHLSTQVWSTFYGELVQIMWSGTKFNAVLFMASSSVPRWVSSLTIFVAALGNSYLMGYGAGAYRGSKYGDKLLQEQLAVQGEQACLDSPSWNDPKVREISASFLGWLRDLERYIRRAQGPKSVGL